MKLKARQKSFKKDGKEFTFNEIYVEVEPIKGNKFDLVLSFDPIGRQVIVNNLDNAELCITPSQYVDKTSGEIKTGEKVHVLVGSSYDLALKKRLSEGELFLLKLAFGIIKEK